MIPQSQVLQINKINKVAQTIKHGLYLPTDIPFDGK